MKISATVIADSISPHGIRLTTLQLCYPRWIHAELLTHRAFSRNASSSRAIPVQRLTTAMLKNPPLPVHWGANRSGMQAREECNTLVQNPITGELLSREDAWLASLDMACAWANAFADAGYHKQLANRHAENLGWINTLVTATDYENFFALRLHEDAQPEIKMLADAMWNARETSTPTPLNVGDWHLPYVTKQDDSLAYRFLKTGRITRDEPPLEEIQKTLTQISVARCARVSYLTHEGKQSTIEEDLKLYERLVGSSPLHASPAEHQATPDEENYQEGAVLGWEHPELHGNFRGWVQYRKTLEGEFVPG